MTDHRIVRRPSPTAEASELDETGGRAYRGPVELYYPPALEDGRVQELYAALAQVRDFANLDAGIGRLRRAIRRQKPSEPEFAYFLGEAYRRQGRWDAAVEAYRQALELDPGYWPALRDLGVALAASGDLDSAAERLREAAALAPEDTGAAVSLGDALYRSGRLAAASDVLQEALRRDPDSPEAHNNLGAVYVAQRRLVAAEAEFREAIRHQPEFSAAHANLAATLLATGRAQEAVRSYEQALELGAGGPAVEAGYARARAAAKPE